MEEKLLVVNLPGFKIDKYGFSIIGFRFANKLLLRKISEKPKTAKLYKHYKIFGLHIYKMAN